MFQNTVVHFVSIKERVYCIFPLFHLVSKGDKEEGVEHLQPDGTVSIDDILVPKSIRNEHEHNSGI